MSHLERNTWVRHVARMNEARSSAGGEGHSAQSLDELMAISRRR